MEDRAYVVNLNEYESTEIHSVSLYVNDVSVTNFDSFGVEYIPKEIKKFIGNKNIANIFRVQVYDSIMFGCFCIGIIDFMFKGKTLMDFTNVFSPYKFEKDDKVIINYFWNRI